MTDDGEVRRRRLAVKIVYYTLVTVLWLACALLAYVAVLCPFLTD